MNTFLTVKEAAAKTGKSSSSIRRILYPILEDDQHPDRLHIEPSPEEALKLRLKGENFAWKVSEELLKRAVPPAPQPDSSSSVASSNAAGNRGDSALISMLQRELEIKNTQITQQSELLVKQMELINGLSERIREGNILMGSLQTGLTLNSPREGKLAETIKTKPVPASKPEKGTPAAAKAVKPKRGLFARLFR